MPSSQCSQSLPRFAGEWIEAWNSGDVDRIVAHYAADVRFRSPALKALAADGTLTGRDAFAAHVRAGLSTRRNFDYRLLAVAEGVEHATIIYRGPGSRLVCETVRLNGDGRIVEADVQWAEPGPSLRRLLGQALMRGFDRLADWLERGRSRRALAGLDHRMLKDIGLSRADALAEAEKPFWRR